MSDFMAQALAIGFVAVLCGIVLLLPGGRRRPEPPIESINLTKLREELRRECGL